MWRWKTDRILIKNKIIITIVQLGCYGLIYTQTL